MTTFAGYSIRLSQEIIESEKRLRMFNRSWSRAMRAVPFQTVSTEVDDYLDAVDRKLERQRRLAFYETP